MLRIEIAEGRLKSAGSGRKIIIPRTELEEWLTREAARSAVASAAERDAETLQRLDDPAWNGVVVNETGRSLEETGR